MTAPDELEHIQPGYAYHDGEVQQLYDPDDTESVEELFFQRCIDYRFGVLWVHACLNPGPSVTVEVRLMGILIGKCELSQSKRSCKIGGSYDGFKAEVTISLQDNPRAVVLDGVLCTPIGCKRFHVVIPF